MSIATEIARLQQAKADIKTAIQAKGVSVPSSAKLDTYDTYVGQIQQGSAPVLQSKTATPTTSQQVIQPDSGYDGLEKVTISAIQTETKTATPTTSQQDVNHSTGKYMTKVTIAGVTAAIDSNIQAGNIKQGVTILGVTGTLSGGGSTLNPTAGDYPVVENAGIGRIAATSLTTTGISITIPVTGTYRLKWVAFRSSTSGTNSSRLYRKRNNTTSAIGTEITSWTSSYYQANTLDIACNAGDEIIVYARSRGTSYYVCAGALSACVEQKLWTN